MNGCGYTFHPRSAKKASRSHARSAKKASRSHARRESRVIHTVRSVESDSPGEQLGCKDRTREVGPAVRRIYLAWHMRLLRRRPTEGDELLVRRLVGPSGRVRVRRRPDAVDDDLNRLLLATCDGRPKP